MSTDDQRAAAVERAMKLQAGTVLAREVDRLRAELAETRTVGDALAAAVTTWLTQGPDGPMGKTMLCPLVDVWNEVRGDAPAPAEPPAAPGPRAWSRLPGEIPAGSEQWRDGWATGYEQAGIDASVVDHVRATAAEPPAVELPVTLSSVDDVAAVCLAHGLTVRSSGPGWTQWRDPDTKAVVHCEAWQSGVERVTVAGRDRADIYRPVARGTLVAAIEAAWGETR